VYFRISEQEFAIIQKACETIGARSVSDLARSAVHEFIKPQKSESDQQILEMMKTLESLLEDVKTTLRQLAPVAPPNATLADTHPDEQTPVRPAAVGAGNNN
jgi:hypothetical protein